MKITKSELKQIIKEEALKLKKKLQLESELAEVEKELAEVTAGNMHELPDGTKKWKPEFEKLSKDGGYPALKEEETCEEDEAVEETVEEGEAVEEGENCEEEQSLEEMLAEIMAEDETCEEEEVVSEEEACEEEEVVSEEEESGFEGADAVVVDENMQEGWLTDLIADPKKKEEARNAAKMEAESAIKAGEILKWLGQDTLKSKKVMGNLTDEQTSALMSKVEKILDHSEKTHGYKSDFMVTMLPGKDEPTLGAVAAGPKTKLGQALAAMGGAAAGAKRMEESEVRRIFREEAEKAEKVRELKKEANKIISEIKNIG